MPRKSSTGPILGWSWIQFSTTSAPARRCGNNEPGTAATASSSNNISAVRILVNCVQMNRSVPRNPRVGRFGCVLLRSEEHTSELQSRFDLVCRLLLEKKKKQ